MYSKSPNSKGRKLRKIDLPNELKTFFGQRRKFIRGLPSYEQIEGVLPKDHSNCFDHRYGFPIPLQETVSVDNIEDDAYKIAQKRTRDLLHLFFHVPEGKISEPLRDYMLTGGTKPIRVSAQIGHEEKKVYVKLPSIERIVGLSLYNLISNENPVDFIFSEYVFIEDSVPGTHIDNSHIKFFQSLQNLPESLIRLSMQDRFIGINDLNRSVDLPNKKGSLVNLLVQPKGNVVAFDVDCAFTKKYPEYDLVELARERGIQIPKELEERVKKDEAKRITHTVLGTSKRTYDKLLRLMDKIDSLKEQFRKIGFKSAKDYFNEKERWLKSLR